MIDTFFFAIQITGLIAIAIWAYRNDRRPSAADQDGILAMKAQAVPEAAAPETGAGPAAAAVQTPSQAPPQTSPQTFSPQAAAPQSAAITRRPPPRRRFTAS